MKRNDWSQLWRIERDTYRDEMNEAQRLAVAGQVGDCMHQLGMASEGADIVVEICDFMGLDAEARAWRERWLWAEACCAAARRLYGESHPHAFRAPAGD